nr:MAG TPA: hypothetical protein [Caudoviricetes sp.]
MLLIPYNKPRPLHFIRERRATKSGRKTKNA